MPWGSSRGDRPNLAYSLAFRPGVARLAIGAVAFTLVWSVNSYKYATSGNPRRKSEESWSSEDHTGGIRKAAKIQSFDLIFRLNPVTVSAIDVEWLYATWRGAQFLQQWR